jgi:hypothetical protein
MKTSNVRPMDRHTQTKWRIQMTKGTKQNIMGKADTGSKYECVCGETKERSGLRDETGPPWWKRL